MEAQRLRPPGDARLAGQTVSSKRFGPWAELVKLRGRLRSAESKSPPELGRLRPQTSRTCALIHRRADQKCSTSPKGSPATSPATPRLSHSRNGGGADC